MTGREQLRLRRWQERDETHLDTTRGHELLHWLHEPAEWGRRTKHEIRHPLMHRIRLIPLALLVRACRKAEE